MLALVCAVPLWADASGGIDMTSISPGGNAQTQIDAAEPGSILTIPPGVYSEGLVISKALTLNLKGVELRSVAWRKGVLVIENPKGPVVVNDFRVDGVVSGADYGNLAGVRISGKAFDVTLNRVFIRRTAMGILTDNRGGVLRINDSVIEDTGWGDKPKQLSHSIYAGIIDRLAVRNSRLVRSHNRGHLLKSRAKITVISDSALLGEDSHHSRLVDIPCGGELHINRSYLQRSSYADNLDLLAFEQEPRLACRGEKHATSVSLTQSLIELASPDDEGGAMLAILLFNFARPPSAIVMERNHIVTYGKRWLMQAPVGSGANTLSLPDTNTQASAMEPGRR